MKRIIFLVLLFAVFSCGSDEPNPCLMALDFIKSDLAYPSEAEISMFDCEKETVSDGRYSVLQVVTAKNAFGVETRLIYKVELRYLGGIPTNSDNWSLVEMQSEEYLP